MCIRDSLLAAQWKAGKTTLRDNLLRSMVDGEPFLGRFAPVNDGGAIAVLDFELDEHTMQRWLSAHRFRHQQRVFVLPLKGRVSTFNILDDDIRTRWAESLRAAGVTRLFVDCLRPILDALGLATGARADAGLVRQVAVLHPDDEHEAELQPLSLIHISEPTRPY